MCAVQVLEIIDKHVPEPLLIFTPQRPVIRSIRTAESSHVVVIYDPPFLLESPGDAKKQDQKEGTRLPCPRSALLSEGDPFSPGTRAASHFPGGPRRVRAPGRNSRRISLTTSGMKSRSAPSIKPETAPHPDDFVAKGVDPPGNDAPEVFAASRTFISSAAFLLNAREDRLPAGRPVDESTNAVRQRLCFSRPGGGNQAHRPRAVPDGTGLGLIHAGIELYPECRRQTGGVNPLVRRQSLVSRSRIMSL